MSVNEAKAIQDQIDELDIAADELGEHCYRHPTDVSARELLKKALIQLELLRESQKELEGR